MYMHSYLLQNGLWQWKVVKSQNIHQQETTVLEQHIHTMESLKGMKNIIKVSFYESAWLHFVCPKGWLRIIALLNQCFCERTAGWE